MNKKLKSISLIFLMISSLIIPTVQAIHKTIQIQNWPSPVITMAAH